jgi:DNA polymerase-4
VASRAELEAISLDLLEQLMPTAKGIRLLGVTLSSLEGEGDDVPPPPPQMSLAL